MEGVIVLEKEKVKKNCHFKIFNATIMTLFSIVFSILIIILHFIFIIIGIY
jgi:hypothetical protein